MRSTRTLILAAAVAGLTLAGCAREQEMSPPAQVERIEVPSPRVYKPMPETDSAVRQAPPSQAPLAQDPPDNLVAGPPAPQTAPAPEYTAGPPAPEYQPQQAPVYAPPPQLDAEAYQPMPQQVYVPEPVYVERPVYVETPVYQPYPVYVGGGGYYYRRDHDRHDDRRDDHRDNNWRDNDRDGRGNDNRGNDGNGRDRDPRTSQNQNRPLAIQPPRATASQSHTAVPKANPSLPTAKAPPAAQPAPVIRQATPKANPAPPTVKAPTVQPRSIKQDAPAPKAVKQESPRPPQRQESSRDSGKSSKSSDGRDPDPRLPSKGRR